MSDTATILKAINELSDKLDTQQTQIDELVEALNTTNEILNNLDKSGNGFSIFEVED